MKNYDVIIAGGGVAGLSCALTLASAKNSKDWAKEKSILVVDANDSDLNKAHLFNVPGVEKGKAGKDALVDLKKQVESYGGIDFTTDTVLDINGEADNFSVRLENGEEKNASVVVVATGFHGMQIKSLEAKAIANTNAPRPGKIQLSVDAKSQVQDGIFVAGVLSGLSSMFAVAAGSGVQVACNIINRWSGSSVVIHDVWKG